MSEINTDTVFKQIKKQNGEGVAKVIREAVLLDVPNIVHILEFAGNNPEEIKQLVPVIREIYKIQPNHEHHTNKNPLDLLNDAGYDAFIVKSLKQQNSIKKYFRAGEELCTFGDSNRYKNYYMIHAVKKDVDKIKRAKKPDRQDEYGTSVISIQIAKDGGFISIKNRYNHTVNNPDATFNNNPDNIIPGLSESLKRYFNVDFNTTQNEMPGHFRMLKDQFVRFNCETRNIYFGSDYYFTDGIITKLNKDYEIMLDNFILDTRTGKIKNPDNISNCKYDILSKVFNGKKIEIKKSGEQRIIFVDGERAMATEKGQIVELNLPNVKAIGDNFLYQNNAIKVLNLPNVKTIGNNFLTNNDGLEYVNLQSVEKIGDDFLSDNDSLVELNLPNVKEIDGWFLGNNHTLKKLNLPKVKKITGVGFLESNNVLSELNLPLGVLKGDMYNNRLKMIAGKTRMKNKFNNVVNKLFAAKSLSQNAA